MFNPVSNCIYPNSFHGHADHMLCDEPLPYLLKLNQIVDIRAFTSLNQLGQDPITKNHRLFVRFEDIIKQWQLSTRRFLQEELQDYSSGEDTTSCASSHAPIQRQKLEYITMNVKKHKVDLKVKNISSISKTYGLPQLPSTQLSLLRVVAKKKSLGGEHAIAYASRLGYDRGCYISGVTAKSYITKLKNAYLE